MTCADVIQLCRQCAFMSLSALLFNRSHSVDSWTQADIDAILFHGDRMHLHALTNEMVPGAIIRDGDRNEMPF